MCLRHLQQKLIETKNGVIRSHAKCYSYCHYCVKIKVCADCKRKGHGNVEPELRACGHCLNNDEKCNRLAVIVVSLRTLNLEMLEVKECWWKRRVEWKTQI